MKLIVDYLRENKNGVTEQELKKNVFSINFEQELRRLHLAGVIYKTGGKWKIAE